jgi:hypothetical protein
MFYNEYKDVNGTYDEQNRGFKNGFINFMALTPKNIQTTMPEWKPR